MAGGACAQLAFNTAPVADAGADQTFTAGGGTVTLSGGPLTDPEGDPLSYQWTQSSGPGVSLSSPTSPTTTFTLPAQTSTAQTFEFTLVVSDGLEASSDVVIVTLAALNSPPVVDAGSDQTVTGGSTVTLGGSATDADNDPLTYQWTQTSGPSVTLSGATTLTPSFTAPPRAAPQQTLTFSLVANDGSANSTPDTVDIIIPGNNAPIASAGSPQTVSGDASVTLDASGSSDPDGDALSYSWAQLSGPLVTLSAANTTAPTFTAPPKAAAAQILQFQVTVTDTFGAFTNSTVDVTVNPNQVSVANAGPDQTVSGGASVTLAGSATDPDNDPLTYQWTQVSGPSVTLAGATTLTPNFTAPVRTNALQTLTFSLVANDGIANSPADTVDIFIPANTAPVASAGAGQTVAGGAAVTLDGSGSSDPDGDSLTYAWTQTSGPSVTLTGATTTTPTFTAPVSTTVAQTLAFQLVVTDPTGDTGADTVAITVTPNQIATVNAGPDQTVTGGATVTLAGMASDPDNDPLTYQWTQTSGPSVTLSGATTLTPSFTAPPRAAPQQTLTFSLVANDGSANSTPDTVDIIIPGNNAPVASAGTAQTVSGGASVTLDASGSSDADGDALSYSWAQLSGPLVTLASANTTAPTFTAPSAAAAAQILQFAVTVTDTFSASNTSTVDITVSPNQVPVVDAGQDQTVTGGSVATLAGTASDADNDPLTYQWTQTSGPAVTLSGATTLTPSFTTPLPTAALQTLTFSLVANDGVADSAADTVDIFVPTNNAPAASAGVAQTVTGGTLVTLDASGSSDPDGDALTYAWTQISGPSVTLTGAATVAPTFTAPSAAAAAQILQFAVTVTDPFGASSTGTVAVTVSPNQLPVADAGADQGPIDAGQTVTLDGTGSSDPDGDPLTYSWVQLSGPAVTLSNASDAQPTFVAPNANATATFELTVSDGQSTSTDTVAVELRAVGTITIVQQLPGAATQVSFTSNLPALSTSVTTANGVAQISAQSVPIGAYTVTAGDLSASGVALTDISCSDTDSAGDVTSRTATIQLAAGEDVTCTFSAVNSRAAAQAGIYTFLSGRNALILANQPDLRRRIDRLSDTPVSPAGSVAAYGVSIPGAKSLPLQANVAAGQAAFSTSLAMISDGSGRRNFDVWAEGRLSRATIGDQDADFSIVYLGADYRLRDNVLVGGLVQFDSFSDRDGLQAGEGEGDGWMAGPYVTARLAPQLYLEVRAAWGRSDNVLSPLPGQRDAFETDRSLYAGSIFGEAVLGQATILRPVLSVRYLSEEQLGYTDSLGIAIPSQTVDQGEVSFSPRLSHLVEFNNGSTLRPFVQLEGIYTFGADPEGGLVALIPVDFDGLAGQLRGRAETGFDFHADGVLRASLSGFYDGIGSDDFSNYGLRLGVSVGY